MPVNNTKSAIKEVRDQLFLDYADGSFLNTVTANLGLTRPSWGFSDDTWRAVGKILGLNYKQITTQFEQILSVIYGPKVTKCSSLASPASSGDRVIYVVSTDDFPQIGTLVLDEGLLTEEIVKYHLIDRREHKIFLSLPLVFDHENKSVDFTSSSLLSKSGGDTTIVVDDSSGFPTTGFAYPINIGAGTDVEEVVYVTANDTVSGELTVQPLTNNHEKIKPTEIFSSLRNEYVNNTYHIVLEDTAKFPESGVVSLSTPPHFIGVGGTTTTFECSAGTFTPAELVGKQVVFIGDATPALAGIIATISGNTDSTLTFPALGTAPVAGDTAFIIAGYTASGGTATSVTLASSSFISGLEVGNQITFLGNVTSALAGVTVDIESNTAVTLSFDTSITSPVAGDIFYIRPRTTFTRNSYNDNTLILKKHLGNNIPSGTKVELLSTDQKVSFAQVQIKGSVWDVIQSDYRNIEILIPDILNPISTVRSSSYLHQEEGGTPGSSLALAASVGDTRLNVSSTVNLPVFGMIDINAGTEIVGYGKELVTNTFLATGSSNPSTGAIIKLSIGGLVVNSLALAEVMIGGYQFNIVSNTADTLTLSTSIPNHVFESLEDSVSTVQYYDPNWITLGQELANAHAFATLFLITEVPYVGDTLINGNYATTPNTFPGPYVYSPGDISPNNLQNVTTLGQKLAGPMQVVIDQLAGNTALEVEDASFLELSGYPYTALVGDQGGSREIVEITDIGLRQLTQTTLAAATTAGDTFIEVASLGASSGSRFINAGNYRVIIEEGTVNEEIIYVSGVDGTFAPDRIFCEPVLLTHPIGSTVRLLADVLKVSPLEKNHNGYISLSDKNNRYPSITSTRRLAAETVRRQYASVLLTSTTGLNPAGYATINFGNGLLTASSSFLADLAASNTTLSLADTSEFPTTNYPYPIIVGKGTYTREVCFVTNNDTGLNQLTISSATNYDHFENDLVEYSIQPPESIEYTSFSNNLLSFSSPVMLRSNHHIHESVFGSNYLYAIKTTGYDFPLRLPADFRSRLEYLFNLLRAAGIQVNIISSR